MGALHKISVDVDDESKRDIDEAVASGDYPDAQGVVKDALQAWRKWREMEIARLRQAFEEGLASGEARPVPDDWAEQIIARGEQLLAEERRLTEQRRIDKAA